ncbi:MAG: glycosyltransferase [Candidatus Nanopelagicales bacterium]|nr:glycosyltransferase [Candidatus Nanopelagicales bacterium]
MIDGKRVVYAYNAFYQGREDFGPTSSWEITWGNSLEHFFGPELVRFNPDAFGPDSNAESDAALLELVREHDTELLVMISHVGAGWTRAFISKPTLAALRSQGIKVVSIWGDIQHASERVSVRALNPQVDLNVCTASSGAAARLAGDNPVLYSWVPISDAKVEPCDCGAMVSLAGSLKLNRQRTVQYLQDHGVRVHAGGGEGTGALTREGYLRMLAHPMTLGFANTGFEAVTNARTFEALTQGAVLLEAWGTETAKILRPYDDYVPWHSHEDLLRKVTALTADPDELARISANGQQVVSRFTDDALWNRVLNRIGLGTGAGEFAFVHPVDWTTYQGRGRWAASLRDQALSEPRLDRSVTFTQRAWHKGIWELGKAKRLAKKVLQRP